MQFTPATFFLAAAAAAFGFALFQAKSWAAHRSAGRGTPQYARARDGRRVAIVAALAAALLITLATLTPLGAGTPG